MAPNYIIRAKAPRRRALRALIGALGLLAALGAVPAAAQSASCDNLRAQIAAAGNDPNAARYRAAAAKQQQEIDRTAAYGRSIGCDRQQFLFFGSPPPPQCGAVNGRIAQMRANLASLQRSSGEGRRQALLARFDAQCGRRVAARPRNIFEELFGGQEEEPAREAPAPLREEEPARGLGGSMAICVRACDGGFFPMSYSARSANLADLQDLCRAQCPNVEVTLYTRSPARGLETALSIDGEPYSQHPNALKFAKSYDPSCTCRPPGRSWAEALEEAERMLAERHRDDLVVSEERAEALSRPVAPRAARGAVSPSFSPVSAPEVGAAGKRPVESRETTREVVGPGGVRKKVRVIAPLL